MTAASRQVERHCGQRFWQDPQATTRYFTPDDRYVLRLARTSGSLESATVTSVTSVTLDESGDGTFDVSWTEDTDYFLDPRDAAESDEPHTTLRVLRASGRCWPVGGQVKVVGVFGWPAVPQEVKEATGIQAQVLFKRATEGAAPIVTMDGTTLQGGSKFLDRGAQLLLTPYVVPA